MRVKFKNRLALFNTLAGAFTIGIVFIINYSVIHYTSNNHLDRDLNLEKDEIIKKITIIKDSFYIHNLPEWEEELHNNFAANPTFIQLLDVNGEIHYKTSNLRQTRLMFNSKLTEGSYFSTIVLNQKIRQGQFPIKVHTNKTIGYIIVAVSRSESAIVLSNLKTFLIIAFPLIILVLFLTSYLSASAGISPVNDLVKAADQINESDINQRLPIPQRKDEIYNLAITINSLLERIEQSFNRERQFTGDASHELRTPLTSIKGNLEVLIRKVREPVYYQDKINEVLMDVERLNLLIDQLLQLSRIESGLIPLKMMNVNLSTLFNQSFEKWKIEFAKKNLNFINLIPKHLQILTDQNLFQIIIDNIFSNAIKFHEGNGALTIDWQNESNKLTITGDGPGVEVHDIEKIFNRFYRVDSSRNQIIKGSGLGLSIVKKLCDILNIDIQAKSEIKKGTSFVLIFRQF